MKAIGSRRLDGSALDDQGRLARTAAALWPGGLAPRGVYRFASFEEADRWLTYRPQDAIDRAFLRGLTRDAK